TSKESSAKAELTEVTAQMAEQEGKANDLAEQMTKTQQKLADLQAQIKSLKEAIAKRENKLAEQARSVQTDGNNDNYVAFLMDSENFSDAIGRIDVVSELVKANKELIDEQAEDQKTLSAVEEETKSKLAEQDLLAAKLEAAKTDLEQKKIEKEAVVAS